MNMLGFKMAVDGLNKTFASSGRGGYDGGLKMPTDEEYFLADCLEIIKACVNMPQMEDSIIPVTTKKKRNLKQKIKGEPKEISHEIYIAQINPKGVKFDGIETHTGLSPVIGMIDDDKMFVYSRMPDSLSIMTFTEYKLSPFGYYEGVGDVLKDGLSDDFEEVRTKEFAVRDAHHIEFKGSYRTRADQKHFSVMDNWVKVADIVGKQRRAFLEKTKEPTAEEMGE